MKKVLAFGASSSAQSINRRWAHFVADQLDDTEVIKIDLRDLELPLYSIDREREEGIPQGAKSFLQNISEADGIVISMAEHNHSYTAVFKNLLDWTSRLNKKLWQDKPMMLLSSSPGSRGGANVMKTAQFSFPFFGGRVVCAFSLPNFHQNFDDKDGILDDELQQLFQVELAKFTNAMRQATVDHLTEIPKP